MIVDSPAPLLLAALGWVLLVPSVLLVVRDLRGAFLPTPALQHAWLGAIVGTALLWTLHVPSPVGLEFGLLGSALFTLVFGRTRAVIGLLTALLLNNVLNGGSWWSFGLNGVLLAVLPACLTSALQRTLEQRLPKNIFVFIIGNGLFVTLLVTALAGAALLAVAAVEMPVARLVIADHLAYSLLLAWGEALVSGMVFSSLVVFLPQVVLTYRQDEYLPPRRHLQ